MFLYGFESVLAAIVSRRRITQCIYLRNLSKARDPLSPIIQEYRRQQDILRSLPHLPPKVQYVDRNELTRLCEDIQTGGVALQCGERAPDQIFDKWLREPLPGPLAVYPVSMRDPINLGALGRTCAAVGATLLLPMSHAIGITPAASKASRGTLEYIRVVGVPTKGPETLRRMRQQNVCVLAAMTPHPHFEAAPVTQRPPITQKTVVVLGNEFDGLPDEMMQHVSGIIHVPSPRRVDSIRTTTHRPLLDSLNVNSAAAISLITLLQL